MLSRLLDIYIFCGWYVFCLVYMQFADILRFIIIFNSNMSSMLLLYTGYILYLEQYCILSRLHETHSSVFCLPANIIHASTLGYNYLTFFFFWQKGASQTGNGLQNEIL
jgi:hypothetical protein